MVDGPVYDREMYQTNYTINRISETIINLERKYNLLSFKTNDVYVWQAARVNIYVAILNLLLPNNAKSSRRSLIDKLRLFFRRFVINSLLYNPFLDFKRSEVLVFDSGRKYYVNSEYIDIYTYYLCQELSEKKIEFRAYNTNFQTDNLGLRNYDIKHLDFILLNAKIISKFYDIAFNETENGLIKLIELDLNEALNIRLDIRSIFVNEIKSFKSQNFLYKKLLNLKRPREVYLTSSGDKCALTKAAKDKGIIVNELQHGLLVSQGLIGHYPDSVKDSLEYFPHRFHFWQDLDMCTCTLPLSDENIIPSECRYLKIMLESNKTAVRNKKQILIISQPYCSQQILTFIIREMQELKEWKFIYKIHPSENPESIFNAAKKNNVYYTNLTIVGGEVSIYRLFAESQYIIGVFSTALFEASYFKCNIILLDLPGVEMAAPLIQKNKAVLVSADNSLKDILV